MKKTHLLLTSMICALAIISSRAQTYSPLPSYENSANSEESVVELVEECQVVEAIPGNYQVPPVDLSQVKNTLTFSHEDFTAGFPTEYYVREKDGMEIIRCFGTGYELAAVVCPLGLEPETFSAISQDLNFKKYLVNPKEENIGGLYLTCYDITDPSEEADLPYTTVRTLNSGDKTYFFFQSSQIPSQWWPTHLGWKIDGKTKFSSSQKIASFTNFMHDNLYKDSELEFAFREEGKSILITIKADHPIERSKEKSVKMIFYLTKCFTAFKEFAQTGYDFSITIYDGVGTLQNQFNFPQSKYSKWVDEESVMKFLDEDLPEGTMELEHRAIGG